MRKENDAGSKDRLKRLDKELADLEEQADALTAKWKSEKDKLSQTADLQKELDKAEERARRGDAARRLSARRRTAIRQDPRSSRRSSKDVEEATPLPAPCWPRRR